MLGNSSVTIFNAKKCNGKVMYTPTQISQVSLQGTNQYIASGQDDKDTAEYYLRLWINADNGKQFVDSYTYKSISAEDKDNYYSLQKGDIVVKGLVDDNNITLPSQLYKKYGERALTVVSIADNTFLGGYTSHIKAVLK